ncbi:MAG: aminoglycoside phosphotransferase family protein [Lapillicoccus sp.]
MPPLPYLDGSLVRRLVADQFPEWAGRPVTAVVPGGVDNRTFRLGDDLSVRLPAGPGYASQVAKEQRWLPVLGRQLPLAVPAPVGLGAPGQGYPFAWSVYRWLDGETAAAAGGVDLLSLAVDLGGFLTALRQVDPTGGPGPGEHNFFRGGPLRTYEGETHAAIAALGDAVDGVACAAVWREAMGATWGAAPVWLHGDVAAGNLLLCEGRLSAVIDFGTSGVGDPACDLVIAWTLFEGTSRAAFRRAVGLDDGTWARARGWAIWKALITLAGTSDGRSPAADRAREGARRTIRALLGDTAERGRQNS